ncbi:MAG: helix-turn-helix domain-containing protein [Clostridiales bacterium]|nr:helix-turn-helix domain-containing protein [Clostridiales bacterium]
MTLGEKLRDCRKRAGLSQEALAEKLHVSRQAITKWECGGGIPDVENLQRIAALFGVTMDELLREEDSIAPSVLREELDLAQYEDTGRYHARQDAAVKAHFPQRRAHYPADSAQEAEQNRADIGLPDPAGRVPPGGCLQ